MAESQETDSSSPHPTRRPAAVIERIEREPRLQRWSPLRFRHEYAVGAGAMVGVGIRFGISTLMSHVSPALLPLGTLIANLLGCLLIGVMQTLFLERLSVRREVQLFVSVGLLGGLTTFSTFSLETISLLESDRIFFAFAYQIISLVGGIGAVLLGMMLARRVHSTRRQTHL
jgi:fluoride exporter